MEMFNPINCKAYLSALEGGRIVYPLAPTTAWRQEIRATDTQSAASTISIVGSVDAIHDGQYGFSFYDPDGNDLLIHPTVQVVMPEPADETELAAAIAQAFEEYAGLDDYRASATSDGTTFVLTLNPGMALRMVLEDLSLDDVTIAHVAEINLNALNDRNTFPRCVTREADPYILVTEEWPTDTVITVEANGVVNSQVISEAPIDAAGVEETASATTLSASDMVELAWDPVATLALGDDPFPTDGALEVIVPFSPIFAPVRLP